MEKFDLLTSAKQKILIVAHRGSAGGNIPCNTFASYEIALKQGADVIETDVEMSADGKLVWVNSIIYNYRDQLSGGHSDDTALCSDMDDGWGWLARRGFDFIQTDWTSMLHTYLKENGLLYR